MQSIRRRAGAHFKVAAAVVPASRVAARAGASLPQVSSSQQPMDAAVQAANRLGQDANHFGQETFRYGNYFAKRFPEGVGHLMGNVGSAVVGARAQASVEVANDIFKALGMQIWIIQPDSPNARVKVTVDEDHKRLAGDESSSVAMTPHDFVNLMRSARSAGNVGGYDLEEYVDRLVASAHLQAVPLLPAAFQKKLYMDITQLILFTFQKSITSIDNAEVWGHTLKLSLTPAKRFVGQKSSQKRRRASVVGQAQLKTIVDHMLASKAVSMPLLPGPMQHRLYTNCMTVVFVLLEDLLTGENEGVSFMGHKMRFHLSPLPVDFVKRVLEEHPVHHCQINEPVLTELVDELLSHSDTNLAWMPDVIESRLYQSTMRLLIRIVEHIVCRMELTVLGRHIDMSILSQLDMRRAKSDYDRRASAGVTYYEEENPLLTVSSTELEERLKSLDERRRVLEALRDLNGASFDLTQETPLLAGERVDVGVAAEAGEGSVTEDRPQVHEFQRLAPTLKLARTLYQTFEVDANIEVPYTMIADLEGYASWMPWCTSGEAPPEALPFDTPKAFDGKVGFGFETGTFLGTVGDIVHYRLTIEPPTTSEGTGVTRGRVLADAENGFTYGKRLAYDWSFTSMGENRTKVELNMLFQAHNVLYMPIWDSMQNMVVNGMLGAFQKRAAVLSAQAMASAPRKPVARKPVEPKKEQGDAEK